ncbi:AbrB/MazE/SpoVT family DNA-binding domain-containing protein [Sulfurimonas autotrophica]|uniref:Transcriptional regulator/antitoxin, MazE n=1 Tax=Sulfurimonas autotrophica (strain ATCC BAA-671 / DSM 16294 / JCM 11897 / OK10) TaxID=563040 RepID=E0URS6_SULAO|nr:AbrB/MazE/SpoVT family DNA-binding domain-containing protein [Sulfurimonas autotrophica]ADN10090.1 transcriptional regulator/antitoxin, MazE [Sulfurimonas autotrophica DSM 16294]
MTTLTKIGNSQGIRIPKPLIQQAHLENVELELQVLENGLLIKPVNNTGREGWEKNIEEVISKHKGMQDDGVLEDLLNDSDLEDWQW